MSGCLTKMLSFICLMSINFNKLMIFGPTSALVKLNFSMIYANNFPLHFHVNLMTFILTISLKLIRNKGQKENSRYLTNLKPFNDF